MNALYTCSIKAQMLTSPNFKDTQTTHFSLAADGCGGGRIRYIFARRGTRGLHSKHIFINLTCTHIRAHAHIACAVLLKANITFYIEEKRDVHHKIWVFVCIREFCFGFPCLVCVGVAGKFMCTLHWR